MAQSDGKSTGCGFDPRSRRCNIYLNIYFHFLALVSRQSAALSSATQHAMAPELGRKWGTECLSLGSLFLPCCVRDTAWSWINYFTKVRLWASPLNTRNKMSRKLEGRFLCLPRCVQDTAIKKQEKFNFFLFVPLVCAFVYVNLRSSLTDLYVVFFGQFFNI